MVKKPTASLSEDAIQQQIFIWYQNNYCLKHHNPQEVIFHVPNENQHRLVRIGVLAGVSDLIFSFRGKLYFCEVKTATGSQTASQRKFEARIKKAGFEYFIVKSLIDFQNIYIFVE